MKKTSLRIKFDGPALAAHEMDAMLLGPSLFAIGELCKEANHILNGQDSKVKVLVKADIRANCVTVELAVLATWYEAFKSFIQSQDGKDIKEVLEWLGVVGGGVTAVAVGAWSLIKFLAWKKDQKEESVEVIHNVNGNQVVIKIQGNNNTVTIPEEVFKLAESPKIVEAIKTFVAPVSEANGITEASFIHGDSVVTINAEEARSLREATVIGLGFEPQTFTAHIMVHSPVFDGAAKKWKFKFNNRVESIDISETNIAQQAVERGAVNIGDTYRVKLEMTERKTANGIAADLKVKEVLEFIAGTGGSEVQREFPIPEVGKRLELEG